MLFSTQGPVTQADGQLVRNNQFRNFKGKKPATGPEAQRSMKLKMIGIITLCLADQLRRRVVTVTLLKSTAQHGNQLTTILKTANIFAHTLYTTVVLRFSHEARILHVPSVLHQSNGRYIYIQSQGTRNMPLVHTYALLRYAHIPTRK